MKTKHAIAILIFGYILSFIGALLKILHWPYGNQILIAATFLQVTGGILFLYKLLTHPKVKDFLNW